VGKIAESGFLEIAMLEHQPLQVLVGEIGFREVQVLDLEGPAIFSLHPLQLCQESIQIDLFSFVFLEQVDRSLHRFCTFRI
jgi:hypothetical protein